MSRLLAFSSSQYVQAAVVNVEAYLEKQERWNMPAVETPMVTSFVLNLMSARSLEKWIQYSICL